MRSTVKPDVVIGTPGKVGLAARALDTIHVSLLDALAQPDAAASPNSTINRQIIEAS